MIAPDSIAAARAKRILLVEDHDEVRSMLGFTIRCFGYETTEAATGAEAIEKASFENPDLIVMDIGLPDMTGIQAAKAIKANPNTSRLPIIAYSAYCTRSWMQEAADVGIAAYLVKPVPMAQMKETIEKFILL
jgi:CheY-like chemotaxis protein